MTRQRLEITKGMQFGKLTVIKETDPEILPHRKNRQFLFKCKCGKEVIFPIARIKCGNTKSCGCWKIEHVTKHGLYYHPLCSIYNSMVARCYNKEHQAYNNYGGRGIKVSKEWRLKENYEGLKNFIAWNNSLPIEKQWSKGLELDRENNSKGYYRWNCRWVTVQVNSNNRRTNRMIEHNNESLPFIKFWENYNKGICYGTAKSRLSKGFTPLDAVTLPLIRKPTKIVGG